MSWLPRSASSSPDCVAPPASASRDGAGEGGVRAPERAHPKVRERGAQAPTHARAVPRRAVPRHLLEAVGAEVRDEKVAVPGKGEAVRQGPLEITGGLDIGALKVPGLLLGDDVLPAVGREPDDAASGVSGPESSVALGQDTLGPLQVSSDVLKRASVYPKIENRVGIHKSALPRRRSCPPHESPLNSVIDNRLLTLSRP